MTETKYHFFGIVPAECKEINDLPIRLIQCGKISSVLYPLSFLETDLFNKEKLTSLLRLYQNILETLRERSTVLPVQLNTLAFSESLVEKILRDYHDPLSSLLTQLSGKVEYEVQVMWTNVQQVLKQIAQSHEFVTTMQSRINIQNKDGVKVEDQIYIGKLLADKLETERKKILEQTISILGPFSFNFKTLPIIEESLATHVSFLVDKSKEEIFYEELDKFSKVCEFSELLKFKVIGPLVPYSFATILVNYLNGLEVENFRALLNLSNDMISEKDLKKQMRELALIYHPDKDKTQEEIFKKMVHAYKLISSLIESEPTKTIELSKYKERHVLTVPSISQELVSV